MSTVQFNPCSTLLFQHVTRHGRWLVPSPSKHSLKSTNSGVSRVGLTGGFQSHKFKGLVKVGASNFRKGVIRVDYKKNHGRGGVPGNQKTPLDTQLTNASYGY